MGSKKRQDASAAVAENEIPVADAEHETPGERNPTAAELEAEASRLERQIEEEQRRCSDSLRRHRDDVLRDTLRAALLDAGAKPERVDTLAGILVADGKITLDQEGSSLVPVREEDLDVALLISGYRAAVPELFRGEGRAPKGAGPTPSQDKYLAWRRRLEAER